MKKVLLILASLLFIFNVSTVNAEVETKTRDPKDNYGVKKGIKVTDGNLQNVLNTAYVDSNQKIYDFANLLTESQKGTLKVEMHEFIRKTKMDLVILTVDINYSDDRENEIIASDFYDYNDFGIDFKNYSGVLLLRNARQGKKYYDMYTFGDAQLYFSQAAMDRILDSMYMSMSGGDYFSAFGNFIRLLTDEYNNRDHSVTSDYYVDENGDIYRKFNPHFFGASFFALVVTTIIISLLVKRNKLVSKPSKADEYLDINTIRFNEKTDKYNHSVTTSYSKGDSCGYGGSGGHSGGSHHSSGGHSSGGHHSSGSSGHSHSSGGGRHG